MAWNYDREMKWHTLPIEGIEEDIFVFVYKAEAGDYVVSAMREGDAGGGEIEYRNTLAQAKKLGEQMAADGSYVDYLTSLTDAGRAALDALAGSTA